MILLVEGDASGSPTLQNGLMAGTLSGTAVSVPCLLNKPDSSRFNGSDLLRSLDCPRSIPHAADQVPGRAEPFACKQRRLELTHGQRETVDDCIRANVLIDAEQIEASIWKSLRGLD